MFLTASAILTLSPSLILSSQPFLQLHAKNLWEWMVGEVGAVFGVQNPWAVYMKTTDDKWRLSHQDSVPVCKWVVEVLVCSANVPCHW